MAKQVLMKATGSVNVDAIFGTQDPDELRKRFRQMLMDAFARAKAERDQKNACADENSEEPERV